MDDNDKPPAERAGNTAYTHTASAPVIAPMRAAHLDALAELERQAFSRPWSYDALAEELQNPLAVFMVAEDADGTALGYLGMHHILDEGMVANLVVRADCRRRGIASALLRQARAYAEEHELNRLTLEVRASNAAAIALYQSHGFEPEGLRPGFYDSPKEDAAIYSLYL